jgi:hypothetical protein
VTNEERRIELARNLRAFARWVESTPEVVLDDWGGAIYTSFYGATKEQVIALAKTEGKFKKDYSGDSFQLERTFGDQSDGTGIRYMMSCSRELVCTSKVVGTRKRTVRDPEAYKNIPMIEVDEDIVEWECNPLLAD